MYGVHRFGSLNPNWHDGISDLYKFLRSNIKQWKIDSMKACNYKCILTGEKFQDIHHLYPFKNIMYQTLDELKLPIYEDISKYTNKELTNMINKCIEIHKKYPLGVCLTKELHNKFHSICGNSNFTPEQFWEFAEKIKKEISEDTSMVSSF